MTTNGMGSRLRFVREKWDLSQTELAAKAGVAVTTIEQVESGAVEPDRFTAWKLADTLQVRPEWLLTGDADVMTWPHHLTFSEQLKLRPPADSGHPDTVLILGQGPWYTDDDGEWRIQGR